jgi:hypothetical protein
VNISLSGTGGFGYQTFVSPSGLWRLDAVLLGGFYERTNPDWAPGVVEISIEGKLTYLGSGGYLDSPHYNGDFKLGEPTYITGNRWYGASEYPITPWTGTNLLTITSIPILEDSSTWTWVAQYQASGPRVPESGGIMCLGFTASLLFGMRRRCGPQGHYDSSTPEHPLHPEHPHVPEDLP